MNYFHKNTSFCYNQYYRIESEYLLPQFDDIEMKLIPILARLELTGILFDRVKCEQIRTVLLNRLDEIENRAYLLAGRSFQITNNQDVYKVFFQELKLVHPLAGMQGEKQCLTSVRKDVLETVLSTTKDPKFQELVNLLLEFRKINRILTKDIAQLHRSGGIKLDSLTKQDDIRLHVSCNTHTCTGRIAINQPNLQSLPKQFALGEGNICIRNTIKAEDGFVLVSADYRQIELRIIAHLAKDEQLISILNGGGDVFCMIASQMNNISKEMVSAEQRQSAKSVCYGILYGMGAETLAIKNNYPKDQAEQLIKQFRSFFKTTSTYIAQIEMDAKKNGFVTTISGRKRYLKGINSLSAEKNSAAARQATNTTVQVLKPVYMNIMCICIYVYMYIYVYIYIISYVIYIYI